MTYATGTTVSAERTQSEIAKLVSRYGATSFATGWDGPRAIVTFIAHGRQVRFTLDLPTDRREFMHTAAGRSRDAAAAENAMKAEVRRRWRCLLLMLKAKLEAVETGVCTFEEEFLGSTVMPGGSTVAEGLLPQIDEAIRTGVMPNRLLAITG